MNAGLIFPYLSYNFVHLLRLLRSSYIQTLHFIPNEYMYSYNGEHNIQYVIYDCHFLFSYIIFPKDVYIQTTLLQKYKTV